MCLICVEFFNQRMTKAEVKNALPEMVLFAKTEEERNHFKKLQSIESDSDLAEEAKTYVLKNPERSREKNDYKASYKSTYKSSLKTRGT